MHIMLVRVAATRNFCNAVAFNFSVASDARVHVSILLYIYMKERCGVRNEEAARAASLYQLPHIFICLATNLNVRCVYLYVAWPHTHIHTCGTHIKCSL